MFMCSFLCFIRQVLLITRLIFKWLQIEVYLFIFLNHELRCIHLAGVILDYTVFSTEENISAYNIFPDSERGIFSI